MCSVGSDTTNKASVQKESWSFAEQQNNTEIYLYIIISKLRIL